MVPDLSFLVDSGFLTTEDLALEPEDAESTILLPAPSIQRAAQEEREGMSPREMIRQRVRRVRRARRRAALSRRASLLFGSMAIEQNGAEPASDTEDGD